MASVGTATLNFSSVSDNAPSVAVPSGGAAGTYYVLAIRCGNGGTVTWPSGFTEITDFATETTLGSGMRVAVRAYDGSEGANFAGTLSSYTTWDAICVPVNGSSGLLDSGAVGGYIGYVASGTLAGGSVTTGGAGRLILWLGGTQHPNSSSETVTITQPSGFTLHATVDQFTDHRAVTGVASVTSSSDVTGAYDGSFTFSGANSAASLTATLVFADAGPPPQKARPNVDVSDGAWTPSTGADNYATIDETPASDTDYDSTNSNSTLRVGLQALSTPGAGTQTVRFRANGSPAKRLIVRLIEAASTQRGTLTVDPLTAVFTDYSFTPSGITDYADLDLEFETQDATSPPTAQVTYGAGGTGASGTTSCTPSYPTGISAATSKLYCVVTGRSSTANTAPTMPAGWTNILDLEGGTGTFGVDTGTRRVTIFRKDTVDGTETGTVTVSLGGSTTNTLRATIHRFEVPGGYSVDESGSTGADTTNATSFSATGSTNIPFAANDLLVIAVAQNIDTGTQTAQSITASGITFGTRTNRASTAVTNGNDHRHIIDTVPVSSGSGTVAPTYAYTISAAGSGPVGFLRLRAVAPTVFGRVSFAEFEAPAGSGGLSASITESATTSESSAASVVYADSRTEPASAADAPAATLQTSAARAEPATASDSATAAYTTPTSDAESAAASDSATAAYSTPATRTEPVAAADASDGGTSGIQSVTEPASAADALASTLATSAQGTEPVGAVDASTGANATLVAVSEPVGANSTAGAALSTLAAALEAVAAVDAGLAAGALIAIVTEAVAADAAHEGTPTAPNSATVTEPASAAEALTVTQSSSATRTEPASAAEAASAANATSAARTESAAAADAASAAYTTPAAREEAVVAADSYATGAYIRAAAVQEGVALSDVLSTLLSTLATIVEGASASDVVITGNFFSITHTEPATAADFVAWVRQAGPNDPRVLMIEAESRTLIIEAEDRTVRIAAEDRRIIIAAEQRSTPTTGA